MNKYQINLNNILYIFLTIVEVFFFSNIEVKCHIYTNNTMCISDLHMCYFISNEIEYVINFSCQQMKRGTENCTLNVRENFNICFRE